MEALEKMANGLGSSLNNALMVIQGYAHLLLGELSGRGPSREYAEEIRKAANSAAAVTSRLLAFNGSPLQEAHPLNVNWLVAEMEPALKRLAGANVELTIRSAPDLELVGAEAKQIEHAIAILVSHARQALTEGGGIEIETANVQRGAEPWIMISVSDDGPAFDPQVIEHLFEPFAEEFADRAPESLDLFAAHRIVKRAGGDIEVESGPERGNTFCVLLPALDSGAAVERPDDVMPRRETVLVVDDEPSVLRVVREILVREGYTVLEAAEGRDALAVAARHSGTIHLLVTDVMMPEMTGRELFDRLAAEGRRIGALYMSGYRGDVLVGRGMLEPGTRLLQKPFSPATLARSVREALEAMPKTLRA